MFPALAWRQSGRVIYSDLLASLHGERADPRVRVDSRNLSHLTPDPIRRLLGHGPVARIRSHLDPPLHPRALGLQRHDPRRRRLFGIRQGRGGRRPCRQ